MALTVPDDELVIVFVAPPWGQALDETTGLDLRQTLPPVADVIDQTTSALNGHKLLFATQVHEVVNPDSLAEATNRFQWSSMRV